MRGENDIGHRRQRVVGGQVLAFEVVQPGAAQVSGAEGIDQGRGVVELGAGGVEVEGAGLHGGELRFADHPGGLRRHGRVHRDDVCSGEQFVEAAVGVRRVRVVGDDREAESLEPPLGRPPDRAETDDPGRPARQLPRPEPLVRDGAVLEHLPGPDVGVGPDHVAGHREQQRDRQFGDRVGVAPGTAEHGDAGLGGGGEIDVDRIAPGGGHEPHSRGEDLRADEVGFDDQRISPLGPDPLGQLGGVVDPQRVGVDPRVVDDVCAGPQAVEPVAAQRSGHQHPRAPPGEI